MDALLRTRARVSLAASAAPVAARLGAGGGGRARALLGQLRLPRPELAAVMALAAALNLWALAQNGWANQYYSAAVRSMGSSWHNFLFASLDPSGVMTVDKPPLALWVQALSVRLFGYHPLSMLVPQALMGLASVALTYDLVRRRFGRLGGAVAGLALAVTPITVAISRHNNPDALLVLCCVAALWCAVRALEGGRTRWLVLAGVCAGLGFETKMGVALVIVPGIAAAWMLIAPRGRLRALRELLAGGAAMVLVGGAWPALVELTPAADRPWISGTSDNSALSLIFGYNGLGRVDGQAGGPGGGPGGGALFGGSPGPFRLLSSSLGGQAGWLLGLALVSALAILISSRLRRADARSGWILVVGGAFACTAALFSFASGIFHPYYASLLAPFTAALVGAGVAQLGRGPLDARVVGPLAIVAGVACELVVLGNYPGQLDWLRPLLIVVAGVAALALIALRSPRARRTAVGVTAAALLVAPSVWAIDTLGYAASGTFPAGGPASAQGGPGVGSAGASRGLGGRLGAAAGRAGSGMALVRPGGGAATALALPGRAGGSAGGLAGAVPPGVPPSGFPGLAPRGAARFLGGQGAAGPFGGDASLAQVLSYVRSHGGGTIAVSSQSSAASAIISEDADVAGIGGFSGRESSVSVAWLAREVRGGQIRWVLEDQAGQGAGPRLPGDTRTGSGTALDAVAATCQKVTVAASAASTAKSAGSSRSSTLYDCQDRAQQLLALAR